MNKRKQSTNRKNGKNPGSAGTDAHFDALGQLLTQLRTHLTSSGATRGTYGDYVRLLEFYRESRGEQNREIIVTWVDPENPGADSLMER